MSKIYQKSISAIMAICCTCLFTGCETETTFSTTETTINPEDVSEEQFIEIVSPEEVALCQVSGKNAIIDFIQNKKRKEWEEVSEIPKQAKLQYFIISYEKVTDEFWQKRGAPEISMEEEKLYEYNGNFYIESVFGDYVTNYCIPTPSGEYMVKLAQNGSDILDKNEIFAYWDADNFDVENKEEAVLNGSDEIFETENELNNYLYSADELAKVSKEQRLEISCQDFGIICTMTDLEEIADFYNQIKRSTWLEIEDLPEEKKNICEIAIYQMERHTIRKNLIENEKMILFEAKNQYYILDVIPSYSSDIDDMEICYSIQDNIASYIKKLVNENVSP